MKIAVAQINTTVGDFAGNAERIRHAIEAARDAGAALVVTPELALAGYPAEDLLLRDDFCDQCRAELMKLASYCLDVAVVVGYPHREGRTRYNAAALLRGGRVEAVYFKQKLPNYSVFDEKRYFEVGDRPCVFEVKGRKFGLTICEDLWFPEPAAKAKAAGAEILISINASPVQPLQARRALLDHGRAREGDPAPGALRALVRRPGRAGVRRRLVRARRRRDAHLPGRDASSRPWTSWTSRARR